MVLGDPQFAPIHWYLLCSRRGVSIRHLGSAPELTVNGKVVHASILRDGDRVRTGSYEFRVMIRWGNAEHRDNGGPESSKQPADRPAHVPETHISGEGVVRR
jgi:hypothetical protein